MRLIHSKQKPEKYLAVCLECVKILIISKKEYLKEKKRMDYVNIVKGMLK